MPFPSIPGYEIHGVAGRGGMGVVYDATRDSDARRVALKVVSPDLTEPDEFQRRFEREVRIASGIKHPHIVPIVDSGLQEDGALAYLAMEFIEGEDLDARVRRSGPLPIAALTAVVDGVAAALDYAHAEGLVHRDVKPANVLLRSDGHVFLTDFGLTQRVAGTRLTVSGAWLGTVDYAAPEQIQGQRLDARTDVYALGALTFYALTGRAPFERDADMAKLWAHVHDPRPTLPMESVGERPAARPTVSAVIERAMAVDPTQRQPSAGDFARAVRAGLDGQTVQLPERSVATGEASLATTRVQHPAPADPPRRSRRRAALAACGLLLVGGGGAAALFSGALDGRTARTAPPTAVDAGSEVDNQQTPPAGSDRTTASTTNPRVAEGEQGARLRPKQQAKPELRPGQSPSRHDDLVLALDSESNVPTAIGSFNPYDNATLGAAVRAFGNDYVVVSNDRNSCELRWEQLGLTVLFANFGSADACAADTGLAQSVAIGPTSDRWRTLSGLRNGADETDIALLYPDATKAADGDWWIVTGTSHIGSTHEFPAIAAQTAAGRVAGFELWIGAAGD